MLMALIMAALGIGLMLFVSKEMGKYFNSGDEQAAADKEKIVATLEKVTRIEQLVTVGLIALLLGAEAGITAIILLSVVDLYAEGWVGGVTKMLVLFASGYFGVWVYRLCLKKKWLENLFGTVAVLGLIVLLSLRWWYAHGMPSEIEALLEQLL